MYKVLTCLGFEHDWRLVALAGTICFLASAVALSLFQRARASQGQARFVWMALQAAVSGCGIWATHFIAMLAYDPGIGAGYSIFVTALSLVFAILITGTGFSMRSPRHGAGAPRSEALLSAWAWQPCTTPGCPRWNCRPTSIGSFRPCLPLS